MCGINGILYLNSFDSGKPVSFFENQIKIMNDEIIHRGPDDEGILIHYPVSLGFRRLSIIDLSHEANQPMLNRERNVAIVFNGEIYNYLELIPDLKKRGHEFKTRSDTEVIIHSYEEYGFDCVSRFNGMWAFVIFDFRKKILFASRDRFGVKPFYYFFDKNKFIFSSEIKAILKVNSITDANCGKVFDYLAYGYRTSNGETFFKNIFELKPSHNIIIQNSELKIQKYWQFKKHEIAENKISDEIEFLLRDAVKLRFRSDVPVSILLSGGLDSSIIAKLTDEMIDDGELETGNVTAFSAVFPDFEFDEAKLIREFIKTCKHIKSQEVSPDAGDLANRINDFVYGMGEPVFNTTSFAHYMLMREIRKQNVKVVLNGQGADEAWCGYDKYIIGYFLLDLLFSNPKKFFEQAASFRKKKNYSYKYILQQFVKAIIQRRSASYLRAAYQDKTLELLSNDFVRDNRNYFHNPDYKKISGDNLNSYLKFNLQYQGFNQILHYEDHSSMQSSIEMRSPFIDYRIMEFAFSIPLKYRFDSGVTKKILREIFREKIPGSIIDNPAKTGFVTPFDKWMKDQDMKLLAREILTSDSFINKSIFEKKNIIGITNEADMNPDLPLWRFINLELWSRQYKINNL